MARLDVTGNDDGHRHQLSPGGASAKLALNSSSILIRSIIEGIIRRLTATDSSSALPAGQPFDWLGAFRRFLDSTEGSVEHNVVAI